jgi:hypothetical protein
VVFVFEGEKENKIKEQGTVQARDCRAVGKL